MGLTMNVVMGAAVLRLLETSNIDDGTPFMMHCRSLSGFVLRRTNSGSIKETFQLELADNINGETTSGSVEQGGLSVVVEPRSPLNFESLRWKELCGNKVPEVLVLGERVEGLEKNADPC